MNVTMRRRIDAIYSKLAPPPRCRLAVVYLPMKDAPPEEWDRYYEEMAVEAETRIIVEYVEESMP